MKKNLSIIMLIVCLLACFADVSAQEKDEYKALVMEYLSVTNADFANSMSESLSKLTPFAVNSIDDVDATKVDMTALETKYKKVQLLDDVASIFIPNFYEQDISKAEFRELIKLCKKPGYILANQHIEDCDIDSKIEKEIEERLLPAAVLLFSGNDVPDLKPAAPRSYVTKFHEYYEGSDLKSLILQILQIYAGSLDNNDSVGDDQMALYFDYMSRNMETMLVDMCYGHLTEADIDAYLSVCNHPSYVKVVGAVKNLLNNAQYFGMAILTKYTAWVKKEFENGNPAFRQKVYF